MIKVKTFVMNSGNRLHHDRLDAAINKFIAENEIEEVVDIKYSTSMTDSFCLLSAMLIYRGSKINPKENVNDEKSPQLSPNYEDQYRKGMRSILEFGEHIDEISDQIAERLGLNKQDG